MKVTFLGHACFLVESGSCRLLFDPFLTGNPMAEGNADELASTHIFVTHGHDDHLGDAIAIARRCGSTVYATVETARLFPTGVKTDAGQIGGSIPAPFGRVKFTAAAHGSSVPGGLSCGFLVELEGKKLYHAGDTGLIMDMALLESDGIDLALLPIGDRYTMGPADALRAVKMIGPKKAVPMHYNTWPPIAQDPHAFKKSVEEQTRTAVEILSPGESLEL